MEAGLECILYVSSATRALGPEEMEHLLLRSRERNHAEGVTGILLHQDGSFMQYIEGPPDGLERIFTIIRQSSLHRGIIELIREPLVARHFPEWSMAFRSHELQTFSQPERYASLLDPALRPEQADPLNVLHVLNSFWNGWGA